MDGHQVTPSSAPCSSLLTGSTGQLVDPIILLRGRGRRREGGFHIRIPLNCDFIISKSFRWARIEEILSMDEEEWFAMADWQVQEDSDDDLEEEMDVEEVEV